MRQVTGRRVFSSQHGVHFLLLSFRPEHLHMQKLERSVRRIQDEFQAQAGQGELNACKQCCHCGKCSLLSPREEQKINSSVCWWLYDPSHSQFLAQVLMPHLQFLLKIAKFLTLVSRNQTRPIAVTPLLACPTAGPP